MPPDSSTICLSVVQGLSLACALLLSPTLARAESASAPTAVIVPPFVQGGVADEVIDHIARSIQGAFESRGWQIVSLDEARALEVTSAGPCSANACALAYARAAGTGAALQLSLFAHKRLTFSLALVQPPNDAFVHDGELEGTENLTPVFAAAATDLAEQRARGAGPWLVVDGAPAEAAVRVDGEVFGSLPLRARVAGGEHTLIVSAEGYRDFNTTIWVPNLAGAVKEVSVDLELAAGDGPARATTTGASRWLLSTDIVLGGVGVSLLAAGLVLDECIDEDLGRCAEYRPQAHSRGLIAGGVAAAGVAAGLLVAGVVMRSKKRSPIRAFASPTAITLSGAF